MTIFDTTTLSAAGITAGSAPGAAAETRANIIEATQAAEDAVLTPKDAGAFPHALRAALAARIANEAGENDLAERYLAGAGDMAGLADPSQDGEEEGLAHVVAFADKAANHTRDILAEDISKLQAAGVDDADIVRLCELVAFVAYQLRVVAGLRLMKGAAA
ncbi:hypothetical protein KUV62_12145 [Salipiger bermudensis]|uniref:hypothetical protein n=1 Tax=Salipiger bermudensis TaxID=344736 RepID=UPI001C99CC2D|nr:hypothetical protein [Salipiger bermudensis]MBY6004665.1 hypothetical protein [Salipiger bermudensis]